MSNGAGIFTRKINGANGWFFIVDVPAATAGQFVDIAATSSAVMGMGSWPNSFVDIVCEPRVGNNVIAGHSWVDDDIEVFAGSVYHTSNAYVYRNNHHVMKIASTPKTVYIARTDPNIHQKLEVQAGSGSSLAFKRTNPTADSREPVATRFECAIKVLSLCPGGPGDKSACNN